MAFTGKFNSTYNNDSFLFSLFATLSFVYVSVNIYFAFNFFGTILSFDYSGTLLFYFLIFHSFCLFMSILVSVLVHCVFSVKSDLFFLFSM